jgi:hypothetical protein
VCSLSFLKTLPEFANYFPQLVRLAGPENFSGVLMPDRQTGEIFNAARGVDH